jgi:hypothetical protein
MLNRKTTQKYFLQSAMACSNSDPVRFRSKVWPIRPTVKTYRKPNAYGSNCESVQNRIRLIYVRPRATIDQWVYTRGRSRVWKKKIETAAHQLPSLRREDLPGDGEGFYSRLARGDEVESAGRRDQEIDRELGEGIHMCARSRRLALNCVVRRRKLELNQ